MKKTLKQSLLIIACILFSSVLFAQTTWQSQIVKYNDMGKLTYTSDAEGNRIPDFSHAGYKNGEAEIPNVPVVKTISPIEGDNTQHIQNAINEVGAMPLDQNGIRGALLLTAGTYQVNGTIRINFDGVVLRGVGDGSDAATNTIIFAKGNTPHQRSVIIAGGGSNTNWQGQVANTKTNITTDKIYVGERSFAVENASTYAPGDNIIIYHPVTDAWIAAVGNGGTTTTPWLTSYGIHIVYNRYIKSINGNTITVDVPVFNTLDKSLSQSYIYKYDRSGLKTNIGIEKLRVNIEAVGSTTNSNGDENHAWQAIDLFQIEDAWVTNCTMLRFGQSGIRFATATRVTVDSCKALEPISQITGERRYNYNLYHSSQQILVKNSLASYARHDFVSNGISRVSGCVFYNCESWYAYASSEGHRYWTQGLLYDNVRFVNPNTTILLGLYSRGSYGTVHGWAAAHSVAWNCTVPASNRIVIQKPPTAQNYAIGCFGNVTGSGPFSFPAGYIEGSNQAGLNPASLFLAQVDERIGANDPPAAPSDLTADAVSSNKINLSWNDNSNNEKSFMIERSVNAGTSWDSLAVVGSNIKAYLDTALTASTTYHYRVRASNLVGNSDYSNTANTTTAPALPINAPTNLVATAVSVSRIDIVWKDNSNNEDLFRVERSANGTDWELLVTKGINDTTYTDEGLADSTTYHYRVRAENIHGNSDYSNTADATTLHLEPGANLALNRPVKFSSEQMEGGTDDNPARFAVDGDTNTRWSNARDILWPQWIEVDLGSVKTFNKTELVCFNDRAYQFTVAVRNDTTEAHTTVVDRTANTTPGAIASPIINVFNPVSARYVRLTITGAHNYPGPWTSIIEFRVFNSNDPVSVNDFANLPLEYDLYQNYPNPFNPTTTIGFSIPKAGMYSLKVYNILGQEVANLFNKELTPDNYSIVFDGKELTSGIYIYRLFGENINISKKMILMK